MSKASHLVYTLHPKTLTNPLLTYNLTKPLTLTRLISKEEFFDGAAVTRAAFLMLASSVLKSSFERAGAFAMVRLITIKIRTFDIWKSEASKQTCRHMQL